MSILKKKTVIIDLSINKRKERIVFGLCALLFAMTAAIINAAASDQVFK